MISYIFISVLILITCFLLGLIVLIQNSKGGGLASDFQSSNQVMGVRKTADFLEKATWTLAIVLLVFSLLSIFVIPRNSEEVSKSEVKEYIEEQGPIPYQAAPQQAAPQQTSPQQQPVQGQE
jgi:preprotein translocase subunit SecG